VFPVTINIGCLFAVVTVVCLVEAAVMERVIRRVGGKGSTCASFDPPPTRCITRFMTAASTKDTTVATANEHPTFIVTGNTDPTRLNFENDHSIVDLVNPFLYHTCIQSDPVTPESWRRMNYSLNLIRPWLFVDL